MTDRIHTSTHPWTPAQDNELRSLVRANTSTADIAARIGRTPEQVFQRASELGVTMIRGGAPFGTR
jgi:hypothetical protein